MMSDDFLDTYQTALRVLTRRDHSVSELKLKLQRKGYPTAAIQATLDRLQEQGWLNDEQVRENLIRQQSQRGRGPLRIAQDLEGRGLGRQHERLKMDDEKWLTAVCLTWDKKFKGKRPSDFKTKNQQTRFLLYRGFTHQQINQLWHHLECEE